MTKQDKFIDFDNKKYSKNNINDDYFDDIEDDILDEEDLLDEDLEIDLNNDINDSDTDTDCDNYIENDPTCDNDKFDLIYHFNTNKHKQEGKHRLKEDTIFKGKSDKRSDIDKELDFYSEENDYNELTKFFDYESEEYTKTLEQNNLSKDVYEVLNTMTDIDFSQNRRKPNKENFNKYYNLIVKELSFRYTKSEIFVELSFYFTDNVFNMYKLLDKKPATIIIKELMQKGYLKHLNDINFL